MSILYLKVEEEVNTPVAWTQCVLEISFAISLLEKLKILLPVIYIFTGLMIIILLPLQIQQPLQLIT